MTRTKRTKHTGFRGMVVFLLAVVLGLVYTFTSGNSPLLGLDLQGGLSVTLQAKGNASEKAVEQAKEIIRNRIDALGVAEPEIVRQGKTVVVQLPGIKDPERARALIGDTAKLEFRPVCAALSTNVPKPKAAPVTTTTTTAPGATTTTTAPGATTTTTAPTVTTTAPDADAAPEPCPTGTSAADPTATATTDPTATDPTATTVPDATATTVPDPAATTAPTTVAQTPADDGAQGLGSPTDGENAAGAQTDPTTPISGETTTAPTTAATTGAASTTTDPKASTTTKATASTTTAPAKIPVAPGPSPTCTNDTSAKAACSANNLDPADGPALSLGPAGTGTTAADFKPTPGEAVSSASAVLNSQTSTWEVSINIKGRYKSNINALFNACYAGDPTICPPTGSSSNGGSGGRVAIVLDGEVISAPVVNSQNLADQTFQITGSFTKGQADDLALKLQYGALPVEFEVGSFQDVSATLGKDYLHAGLVAGIVGLLLVAGYMIIYYRLLGLVAVGSLTCGAALLWVVISYLGETRGLALTLAGITGIIVSLGVAVDSNVVFYEHLREDIAAGRTLRSAVSGSFDVAWRTIVSADLVSLIGAGLLYWLTVGAVRGFAFYLGLSTILDLLASYFFMRPVVLWIGRQDRFQNRPGLVGVRVQASTDQISEVEPARRPGRKAKGATT